MPAAAARACGSAPRATATFIIPRMTPAATLGSVTAATCDHAFGIRDHVIRCIADIILQSTTARRNIMRRVAMGIAAAALLFARPASADTVSDWWDFANRVAQTAQGPSGLPGTPDQQRAVTPPSRPCFGPANPADRAHQTHPNLPPADPTPSQDGAGAAPP